MLCFNFPRVCKDILSVDLSPEPVVEHDYISSESIMKNRLLPNKVSLPRKSSSRIILANKYTS